MATPAHECGMEIPDLVRDRLGGENVVAGVNLGDEDALCLTPSKTIVYKGEGLLSDESVAEFPHDVERLVVSEGRRKTKFQYDYVDGTRTFTVPANRGEKVLELLLGGILRVADVAAEDESVEGVFRFSELTLIITEQRLVKHIGTSVWDDDFEEFAFEAVTGLTFEQGSVATQIVLGVEGRPNRIKAPNDKAPLVRRTLENALFAYHDVESVDELNELLGPDDEDPAAASSDTGAGFGLEDDIDPLVGSSEDDDAVDTGVGGVEGVEELEQSSASERSTPDEEGLRPSSMDVDPTGSGSGATEDDAAPTQERAMSETEAEAEEEPVPAAEQATDDEGDHRASNDPDPTASWPEETAAPGQSDESPETGPASVTSDPASEQSPEATAESGGSGGEQAATAVGSGAQLGPEEVEALETELAALREAVETQNDELREAVQAQNEVLRKQHAAIKRLIAELQED